MTPVSVFYTPHADDEVLGMGGAIAEAKLAGHRVVLVLVTDNRPSVRATDMFTDRLRCHWHEKRKHDLGHLDLPAARLLEFAEAATALGADDVSALGIEEALGRTDYPRFVEVIERSLRRYAVQYPDASHHVTSGETDWHQGSGKGNLSHVALATAAARAELARVTYHRVYTYSFPAVQRIAPRVRHLSAEAMAIKVRAMEAYKLFAPEQGRIAYGYHSVRELFDGAASDLREFEEAA